MIWVVTANSVMCRIYEFDNKEVKLTLIKEINHPENKLKKSEYLTSDKPGRYQNDTSAGGAYSPHSDPKEVEIDNFSREIANELNKGRNTQAYDYLITILGPHMTGLLAKHLDKNVKKLIINEIQKDIVQLPTHEILKSLLKNLHS